MVCLMIATVIAMSCLALSVPAYAADTFSGGSGTFNDPYLVATSADLYQVRNHLNSYFKQTADIDLAGYANWTPIGSSSYTPFGGTYDGDGYTISNLKINLAADNAGLFGVASANSLIIDVSLENVTINVGVHNNAGGVAGGSYGTVIKCQVTGSISGRDRIGGLMGYSSGLVAGCQADVQASGYTNVGGLLGSAESGSTVKGCSSSGSVSASGDVSSAGGLMGALFQSSWVEDSCSSATVSGNFYTGGLLGALSQSTVKNSYSTGSVTGSDYTGGLVGVKSGTVIGCYYDSETSGQSDTGKGTPLTTAQMKQQASYAGWDFAASWQITENTSYPQLRRDNSPFVGLGTAGVPYQVSTAYQLNRVRDYPSGSFIQSNDINLSSIGWVPIGDINNLFQGAYNGNSFTISNLKCHMQKDAVGLFGAISFYTALNNINLENADVQGQNYVGGLVGESSGTISNCHVSGTISGTADYVGGLAGFSSRMYNSSNAATVSASGSYVGGLAGYSSSDVMNCYNIGNVSGTTNVGGLTGYSYSYVSNSYNTGNVTGTSNVGGLVGFNRNYIQYSYSTGNVIGTTGVGGCIGTNEANATIVDIYYNSDNITDSNINSSNPKQGIPKVTSAMKQSGTYTNWLYFSTNWKITNGVSYPQSIWETYRDFAPPLLDGAIPASDSSESALLIKFDEQMQKGTGTISIVSYDDGSSVANIDAAGSQVVVNNNQITVNLAENLTWGMTYTINITEGAFIDAGGNKCRAASGYYVPGNLAFATNGGTAAASSTLNDFFAFQKINDGIRYWYWNDATQWNYDNDWCEVNWQTVQEINRIVLRLPVRDDLTQAQRTMGPLTLQYRDGNGIYQDLTTISPWVAPTAFDGTQKKTFTFYPVLNTQAVRVKFTGGNSDGWTFLEELEVYNDLNALVSSPTNQYTVDNGHSTIADGTIGITPNTTVAAFLGNLIKHSASAWKVVSANVSITSTAQFNGAVGKTDGDSMATGDKLAVLSGDDTTLKVYNIIVKSISLGSQVGTVTAGTAGSVTFSATAVNIPDGSAVAVSWCDAVGNAQSSPNGLTINGTNLASGGSTITVTADTNAAAGIYYFTATSSGVTSGVAAVTVAEPPYDVLVSITAPPDITDMVNGTAKTASALGLPATVTLVTSDGDVQADVTWNVAGSSYDPDDTGEQTFTVNGIVTLPDGVINPDNISLEVSISVTVNEIIASANTGTITGMVKDSCGNPIAEAEVSLTVSGSVYSATTAVNGSYSITNVPAGTGYTVTASKAGCTNASVTNVEVTVDATTSDVDITLTSDEDGCLVTYKGAQGRYNESTNTYDIRFVAIINTLNAKEVGFVFSKSQALPTRENASEKATSTVYTEITASNSSITAASLGGQYIIACSVTGIPAEDINVELHVRAFSTVGIITKYTPVTTVTMAELID